MAEIWKDINIEFKDKKYKVKPTLEFINMLEQGEGRSLSNLVVRSYNRDLPSGIACEVIAKTINYAGGNVTAEEVFSETSGGISAATSAIEILNGCLPEPKNSNSNKKK
jgi:hypothetical protein